MLNFLEVIINYIRAGNLKTWVESFSGGNSKMLIMISPKACLNWTLEAILLRTIFFVT